MSTGSDILNRYFPDSSAGFRKAALGELLGCNYLTIKRRWNNPEIYIGITDVGITINLSLEDFIMAVLLESGVDRDKVLEAVEKVIKGVKEESGKAYGQLGPKINQRGE